VLLEQPEAEDVAEPGENLTRAIMLHVIECAGERLPLQELGVRTGGLDELVLLRVEQVCGGLLRQL